MGKRKKRLLFDVLDDVAAGRQRTMGPTRPPGHARKAAKSASARKPAAQKSSSQAEIRITRDMGITIVVVLLAFIGCAYYSGMVHGRNSANEREQVSLRRSVGDPDVDRSELGEHYAIQAYLENYNRYTREALGATLAELIVFLEDAGHSHVDVYDYPHESEEGRGSLVIWVGRAEEQVDLEAEAAVLRSRRHGDTHPFATAFVRLFTD